jgi:hypothetical protein
MDRRLGSMKIMSSQHLLAQTLVTACAHVEEGPSSDKLHFGVSGIATWRVKMPHLQIHEMRNHESSLCISAWSQSVVTPSKS